MVLKITNLHILRYLPTCWLYLLERYTIDNQRCTHTASVHIRYNYIYSQYQDEEMRIEFQEKLEEYRNSSTDIDKVLNAVSIRENSGKWFCKEVAERIAANDIEEDGGLDRLIINRERRVKGNRRKIGNPAYIYDKKNRIHYYKLTYRWETVKTFAKELRKEAING